MSSTSPSPSSNPSSLGGGAPGISPPLGLLTVGESERSTNRKIGDPDFVISQIKFIHIPNKPK